MDQQEDPLLLGSQKPLLMASTCMQLAAVFLLQSTNRQPPGKSVWAGYLCKATNLLCPQENCSVYIALYKQVTSVTANWLRLHGWLLYTSSLYCQISPLHTQLYQLMSRDFVKAGYLHKTPPNKPVSLSSGKLLFSRDCNIIVFKFSFFFLSNRNFRRDILHLTRKDWCILKSQRWDEQDKGRGEGGG